MSHLFEEKCLEAQPDKTCFIVFGSGAYEDKAEKELRKNPLYFGKFQVKRKKYKKYLGQILHEDGAAASIEETIAERQGRIKGATMEIKAIIEEFQMQAMGGMMAAW